VIDSGYGEGPFGVAAGSLYAGVSYDSCIASRLTGGGSDALGTWTLVERRAEWPESLRPAGCRPILYPDPLPAGHSLLYTVTEKSLIAVYQMELCPGDDLIFEIRDHIETDPDTRVVDASCRHTSWRNAAGLEARVDYAPKGGQDTNSVTFRFGGKTCSYIEPGSNPAGPPACPDPADSDRDAFAACVASSGFAPAAPPTAKRAGGDRKRPRPIRQSRTTGSEVLGANRR
jgi:hypothetical protein